MSIYICLQRSFRQLLVRMKLLGTIIDVRSCVRMGWVGDDFLSSRSELRKKPTYFD